MASSCEKRFVEADEFVLKDSVGRGRAGLAMGEEGPASPPGGATLCD
jgi:hypothetical protein